MSVIQTTRVPQRTNGAPGGATQFENLCLRFK